MASIENIRQDKITEIASKKGFLETTIAKDFYATAIIYLLSNVDGIYFKGGTALQKIFLDYSRLSEDVDYTVAKDIEKEKIKEMVMDSGLFERVSEDKSVDGFFRLVFYYKYRGGVDSVFVDLNQRANLILEPEVYEVSAFL